jgi:hypothetical protein
MTEPPAWTQAAIAVGNLQVAAEAHALLVAADRAGLMNALAAGTAPAEAARQLGVSESRIRAVLDVLSAQGVAQQDGDTWSLTSGWRELARGETPFALDALLGVGRVRAEQVAHALEKADDYWGLSREDRLLVARGVSFDPSTPAALDMVRGSVESMTGLAAVLDDGGSVLELGCGVASRLTATLLAFPRATAVGVELDDGLVQWGRERAARLGVGDRLELVVADAAAWEPDRLFDQVGWSQFFFPEQSRVGALATARLALRSGGWVSMPVIWDGKPFEVGSPEHRELSAERVVLDLWHVPLKSTQDVGAELEAAGFVDVHVVPAPEVYFVRGRQP